MESPTCLKHAVPWFCCETYMKSPSNQSSHRAEKTSGNARPFSCVLILEARIFTAWLYQATLWTTLSHTPRNKKNVFCSTLHTFLTSHSVAKKKLQGHCMSCLICGASLAQGQPKLAGGQWTTQDWSGGCDLNWQCLVKPRLCQKHGPAGRHHSNMTYIYIYVYICMYVYTYGISPATYGLWHITDHLPFLSQNIVFPNKIATSLQSAQSIPAAYVFFNGTNMAGQNLVPQSGWFTIHASAPVHPCSRGKWYQGCLLYGMFLWLLLKMGDPKSPLVVRLKTAHFGWTNDGEIREQIISQPSFIRYILSTYIPICLRLKAP